MAFSGGLFGLVLIGLWIYSVIDVIVTPETLCRHLPKLAWIFIVLLLFVLGSALWFLAGRPWNRVPVGAVRTRVTSAGAPKRPSNPDDDEEFLATLRLRAEEQRRRSREHGDPDTP